MRVSCASAACAGNASLLALVIVVFLSVIGGAAAVATVGAEAFTKRSIDRVASRVVLERAVSEVIDALLDDPTPESDAKGDPVWDMLDDFAFEVALSDVSSRINPNTIRKNLLDRTGLGALLFDPAQPVGSDALQQYRKEEGLSTDIRAHYAEYFSRSAFEELLTGYGWANINVTDEFVLRSIYVCRVGEEGDAGKFRERESMPANEELKEYLGADFRRVYPVINAEPIWNVHFLPQRIVREILSYRALGVEDPIGATQTILSLRERAEISSADLSAITGLPPGSRLHQYLGVRTWFWRIRAKVDDAGIEVILARIPGFATRYQVVERSHTRGNS